MQCSSSRVPSKLLHNIAPTCSSHSLAVIYETYVASNRSLDVELLEHTIVKYMEHTTVKYMVHTPISISYTYASMRAKWGWKNHSYLRYPIFNRSSLTFILQM